MNNWPPSQPQGPQVQHPMRGSTLAMLLPKPRTPAEARRIFRYEVLIQDSTVGTRNAHWAKFINFLLTMDTVLIPLAPSILLHFTIFLDGIAAIKDYISSVAARMIQLKLFMADPFAATELAMTRASISRYLTLHPANKAPPLTDAMVSRLPSFRLQRMSIFWKNAGLRTSGALSLVAGTFPTTKGAYCLTAPFVEYYCGDDKIHQFLHYFPTGLLKDLLFDKDGRKLDPFLPIRTSDVELIRHVAGQGLRGHSFRRAMAIAIRCDGHRRGLYKAEQYRGEILLRINHIGGWLEGSESFFSYCPDYLAFMNIVISLDSVTLDYIFLGVSSTLPIEGQ